ncbi:MAG: rod shape-determining protein MreD [Melioribacteraceae bacterium]|jgi:rod shape-determining protein MreD|nr:rod shape-determining protein MreD [Melioribacteraceae bacterium]
MVNKIIFPIIIVLVLIVIQLAVIPFLSINSVVPNVVLIFLILYSLKHGQNSGTIFAFFIGFLYDLASSGLLGSGMFSFTSAAFVAGYFYKDDFKEIIQNPKIVLLLFMLSSILFFLSYSVLGTAGISIESQLSYITYSILSAFYTSLIALVIYLIPRNRL